MIKFINEGDNLFKNMIKINMHISIENIFTETIKSDFE